MTTKLSKSEIIHQLARKSVITKKESEQYVNNILVIIQENLRQGNEIALIGFGSFAITKRQARDGRNPRTGETIKIPAKNIIKFKTGKALEEAVN